METEYINPMELLYDTLPTEGLELNIEDRILSAPTAEAYWEAKQAILDNYDKLRHYRLTVINDPSLYGLLKACEDGQTDKTALKRWADADITQDTPSAAPYILLLLLRELAKAKALSPEEYKYCADIYVGYRKRFYTVRAVYDAIKEYAARL